LIIFAARYDTRFSRMPMTRCRRLLLLTLIRLPLSAPSVIFPPAYDSQSTFRFSRRAYGIDFLLAAAFTPLLPSTPDFHATSPPFDVDL